jgi:hypothetical protein
MMKLEINKYAQIVVGKLRMQYNPGTCGRVRIQNASEGGGHVDLPARPAEVEDFITAYRAMCTANTASEVREIYAPPPESALPEETPPFPAALADDEPF